MFKKFFKKKSKVNLNEKSILIACLLIHAAKIDENYTQAERKIITRAIMELDNTDLEQTEKILKIAEEKEDQSNQIVEFTREIKQYPIEFRLKIIEIIWKIVYSDGQSDSYESNLIRRICGLLYVSDKESGIIKTKIQNSLNKT